MSAIDNIKDKVKDVTRSAVKASSDFLEVTKMNFAVKSEEDKIKIIMLEIGKVVYESYKDGKSLEAELSLKCDDIIECEKKIDDLKQKILDVKNLKKCSGCSAEIDAEDAYCNKCGAKME